MEDHVNRYETVGTQRSMLMAVGCLIPSLRSSSQSPFLSFAGNTVVSEVFAGGLAGSLHHSALWLRPPNVLSAVTDCRPSKQPTSRDRLGHRPGWGRMLRYVAEPFVGLLCYAVAFSFSGQRNASPLTSIRCKMTANLRASATQAFLWLLRFLIRRAQSFNGWALRTMVSRLLAAS